MSATTGVPGVPPPDLATDGMGWRTGVSIVSVFGLVSFILIYFAFWASSFSWFQNAVIVIVAILVFVAANGAAWAGWGMRHAHRSAAW